MSILESFAAWFESTRLAQVVGESLWLVAPLSGAHVIGYTLVMGSALVVNLRWMGLLLPQVPANEVARAASRGIALGLAVSIATGMLLVSWKATAAASNPIFQIKMLLLVSAAVFHFTLHRSVSRRQVADVRGLKAAGGLGLTLWLGLALAGCAFILLE